LKNDIDSFEEIAMPHLNAVYRAAFTMCNNRETAEDLAQATFLSAFERFDTFHKDSNCKAWLLKILRNKWIDMMRHRSVVGQVSQLDENIVAHEAQNEIKYSNDKDLLANFSDEQVIRALKSLPDEQRFALFLSEVEQLSHEEIAQIMNVPIGTIKSRTSRARAILKQRLLSYARDMGYTGGRT
jgi:RNA polymerase sigma-70 factor (ECF subfamily)